ncbi:uncharacterized protein LOC107426541 [Ziziphus jujuba]|uniref:HVA22-like protein n=1 Tax=Ziziphus jujuba TaxID=326968 RepID=A0A6P4ABG2_ZIZJJ|nr:uncharacterized protein LOC107426541 [Ziziphus jujuba]
MGFVVVVQFAVKYCVGVFAWPLLALGYPLCASVWAIENNSISDTKKLNAYWVVLSLILLLEHALNLLKWLLLWQHIRLMIVCWLVIPHFDGALYVYMHLIRPCLCTDLQNVINKRMESLYAKDNFLAEMEKYVKENGSEALEKIIALKSGGTNQNLDVKDIKAAPSIENKEVKQLNSERPSVTQKDIRPVEVLEKNEVKAAKQDGGVQPNVTGVEYRNFAGPGTKRPVPDVAGRRELPQTPASGRDQKWTCEICHITLQSVSNLNSHLQGQKHLAACEALKTKNPSSRLKVVLNFAGPSLPKVVPTFISKNSNVPNVEPRKSGSKKGHPGNADVRGQQHRVILLQLQGNWRKLNSQRSQTKKALGLIGALYGAAFVM